MVVVTGNACNSIALRNAVLSVIPKPVVDRVYNAAKATITGDVSDKTKLIGRRKQVFDGLKDTYGVTEKEVLAAIGKAAIDHITADDLVVLIGIGTAIKDGDTTVDQAFRPGAKEAPKEATTAGAGITQELLAKLVEEKTPLLTATELVSANRIISQNEAASFKKLHKFLTEKN